MQIFCTALLFFLAATLFSKYFAAHCRDRLEVQCGLDKQRVKAGDTFYFNFELVNKKLLFLPVIKIMFILPSCFVVEGMGQDSSKKDTQTVFTYGVTTSLLSYQKVKKKLRFTASKRGFYQIKVSVHLIDFLGLKDVSLMENETAILIVHPRAERKVASFLDTDSFQGSQIVSRWIYQDPIFYSGIREYDSRDSMKDIDWKASAKSNRLLVKKYDATSDTKLTVFLLSEYQDRFNKDYEQFIEDAAEMMAAFAKEAYQSDVPVGLATNLTMKNKCVDHTEVRCGMHHLLKLFDFISCIGDAAGYNPLTYMEINFPSFAENQIFVLIFYQISEACAQLISALIKRGYSVKVISKQIPQANLDLKAEFYKMKDEVCEHAAAE